MSDFDYYTERLADKALLMRAIDIDGMLAVPVGGPRKGGEVQVGDEAQARAVIAALKSHDGFPIPRYIPGDEEVADNVAWGDVAPPIPSMEAPLIAWATFDIQMGRYYGYLETEIRRFVAEQWGARVASAAYARLGG